VLLTLCLGGIGVGIVIWGQRLMESRIHIEERHPIGTDPNAIVDLQDALTEEAGFSRRKLLIAALAGAFGGLAAALAIPVLSLGPAPGRSLFETAWKAGRRLAIAGGQPLLPDQLPVGGVLTVFPDGDESDPNAAALIINVGPGLLKLEGQAAAWAPGGFVAYSKICTHAGCPVGLYRSSQQTLICPCHQSEFDVLRGAVPISGPAARPLPQLPIQQQADGTFVALGDFAAPVGPSFWNIHSD
jgi:ubiquinol-cytochrome c reductase iron-sulfur subunit